LYYASLANFYTVYDLRNLKPEQILSRLLERLEMEDNTKGIEALPRISPVA
jgi:hypothetical protein